MKYRVAVVLVNGDFRIHGDGCRDIARDARQSDAGEWYVEASTRHEVNIDCWGDVSSDNYPESTPEWHDECDKNARLASHFLPCVPKELT